MVYEKYHGPKISRPLDAVPILQAILKSNDEIDRDKEHFYSIGLNGANKVIYVELVSMGIVNQSPVHPREVFRRAILSACSAIIIGHNHPSGNSDPSKEDTEVTSRLRAAGELLGIEVLDHVIITEDNFYSFAEHDLL